MSHTNQTERTITSIPQQNNLDSRRYSHRLRAQVLTLCQDSGASYLHFMIHVTKLISVVCEDLEMTMRQPRDTRSHTKSGDTFPSPPPTRKRGTYSTTITKRIERMAERDCIVDIDFKTGRMECVCGERAKVDIRKGGFHVGNFKKHVMAKGCMKLTEVHKYSIRQCHILTHYRRL